MTAGERLHQLAGISGTAAALLLAIGAGATTGAALVDYSGLGTGTAAQHLLAERAASVLPPAGHVVRPLPRKPHEDDEAFLIAVLL